MNHLIIDDEAYFSFDDLYKRVVEHFPSGSVLVELGVLHGKSLAYLIVEGVNTGKQFDIVGVDNFRWSLNQRQKVESNLLPVRDRYRLIEGDSSVAAYQFAEKSVDFVFIDANHDYTCVAADIAAWLPRMKSGSWICGHDHDEFSFPGVVRAVKEAFGDDVEFSPWTCWEYVVK